MDSEFMDLDQCQTTWLRKPTQELLQDVQPWVESILNIKYQVPSNIPKDLGFLSQLKTGVDLCRLVDKLAPNVIAGYSEGSNITAHCDNIFAFIRACIALGVQKPNTFSWRDLYDGTNPKQVLICLCHLRLVTQRINVDVSSGHSLSLSGTNLDSQTTSSPTSSDSSQDGLGTSRRHNNLRKAATSSNGENSLSHLSPRAQRLLKRREISAEIDKQVLSPRHSAFRSIMNSNNQQGVYGKENEGNEENTNENENETTSSPNSTCRGVDRAGSIITNLKRILEQKPSGPDPSEIGSPERRMDTTSAASPSGGRTSRQRVQELLESVKSGRRTVSRTGTGGDIIASPRQGGSGGSFAARVKELETENKRLRVEATAGAGRFIPNISSLAKYMREDARPTIKTALDEMNEWLTDKSMELVGVCQQHHAKYMKERRMRKALNEKVIDLQGNIRVFARVRPLSENEKSNGDTSCIRFLDEATMLCEQPPNAAVNTGVNGPSTSQRPTEFEFDRVFTPRSTQNDVFEEVSPLVQSAIDGYNVCIFAYGQTGSGKTFTMEGSPSDRGVNYRALEQLFETLQDANSECKSEVTVSVVEIYNEQVRDLLLDKCSYKKSAESSGLEIRQNPKGEIIVPGLTTWPVSNVDEVTDLMRTRAFPNRQTSATMMNAQSSRSHSLLFVNIQTNSTSGVSTYGRLVLIDLAGSERVKKSMATGQAMTEAQNINRSLSALGDVIASLKSKDKHIPYRNSKLTYLLQDCLGGSSKCLMFCNVSPATDNHQETSCSLKFAQRVRNVQLGVARKQMTKGAGATTGASAPTGTGLPSVDSTALLRAREDAAAAKEEIAALKKELAAFEDLKRQHNDQVKLLREKVRTLERENESVKSDLAQANVRAQNSANSVKARAPPELNDVAKHRRTLSRGSTEIISKQPIAMLSNQQNEATASSVASVTFRRGGEMSNVDSIPTLSGTELLPSAELEDSWSAANNISTDLSLVNTSVSESSHLGFNSLHGIPLTPAKGLRPGSKMNLLSSELNLSLDPIDQSHEISPGQKRKSFESHDQSELDEVSKATDTYTAEGVLQMAGDKDRKRMTITPLSPLNDSLLLSRQNNGADIGKRVCYGSVISKTMNDSFNQIDEVNLDHSSDNFDGNIENENEFVEETQITVTRSAFSVAQKLTQQTTETCSSKRTAFAPSTLASRPTTAAARTFKPTASNSAGSSRPATAASRSRLSQPIRRSATASSAQVPSTRSVSTRMKM